MFRRFREYKQMKKVIFDITGIWPEDDWKSGSNSEAKQRIRDNRKKLDAQTNGYLLAGGAYLYGKNKGKI